MPTSISFISRNILLDIWNLVLTQNSSLFSVFCSSQAEKAPFTPKTPQNFSFYFVKTSAQHRSAHALMCNEDALLRNEDAFLNNVDAFSANVDAYRTNECSLVDYVDAFSANVDAYQTNEYSLVGNVDAYIKNDDAIYNITDINILKAPKYLLKSSIHKIDSTN